MKSCLVTYDIFYFKVKLPFMVFCFFRGIFYGLLYYVAEWHLSPINTILYPKDTTPGKNSVPFKAEFITTSVTTHPGDPIQTDHITGTGQGTPIGKSTFDAVVSFDITGPSPLKITGQQTITTANGDKIFSTIDAYSPDPDEDGNFYTIGSETITGGTGKYANAKGTLTFKASGSLNSPAGDNSFE